MYTKRKSFEDRRFNKNLKGFYTAIKYENKYNDKAELEEECYDCFDVIKKNDEYKPELSYKRQQNKLDDNTYDSTILYFGENGRIIMMRTAIYPNSDFLNYQATDVGLQVLYQNNTDMLDVKKVKDDVYSVTFYDMLGNQKIQKVLSLKDARNFVKEITDLYYHFDIDYKKVYDYVDRAEEICSNYNKLNLCRCECNH